MKNGNFSPGIMNPNTRNSLQGKQASQSSEIHSTQSSRPNINHKNIQGGISQANGSNYTAKS